jgi:hypothetical protein
MQVLRFVCHRNQFSTRPLSRQPRSAWSNVMLEQLRVLVQPGAIIATAIVLLLMAAGDAAIVVAAKGWPF